MSNETRPSAVTLFGASHPIDYNEHGFGSVRGLSKGCDGYQVKVRQAESPWWCFEFRVQTSTQRTVSIVVRQRDFEKAAREFEQTVEEIRRALPGRTA